MVVAALTTDRGRLDYWRCAFEAYAFTVADSRGPVVVKMPLDELRVGEDRGRLDYWRVRKSEPAV